MPAAGVAHVLQKLDQEKGGFDVGGAEAQVLVVAAKGLVVQVDVEEIAGIPGLGDGVQEVQAGPAHAVEAFVPPVVTGDVQALDGRRIEDHLGDLFLQRHLGNQAVHALFCLSHRIILLAC